MSFAVVLVGGAEPDRRLLDGAEHAQLIIAADSGVRIARNHGLPIHVVIGDLDSASPGDVAWATAEDAEIVRHSQDKDRTDLELALDRAESADVDRIIAVGVDGGRLDHELGNWAVLCAERRALVEVHTSHGTATILHGGGHRLLNMIGDSGDIVSLLPHGGPAEGITTTGLRWPLETATLLSTTSRGVSNEFIDTEASVELTAGTLMVVRPRVSALND